MNTDNPLRFPFSDPPAPGSLQEVAPGVKWLRMPLPFALDHINLWILEDDDGWMLVDTGIQTATTMSLWDALFAGPLKAKPVTRLFCTHYHPDHIGLAGWLADRHGVTLEMTAKEWDMAHVVREQRIDADAVRAYYTRLGFPLTDESDVPGNVYVDRVHPLPTKYIKVDAKHPIAAAGTSWQVIIGEGHSPEHVSLYSAERGVLISGDQVLPGISPNISVRPENSSENPLGDYLRTLPQFRNLPEETLVLPSHKLPFYGLKTRVDQIINHHHDRLKVALAACRDATVKDVMAVVFPRPLKGLQIHFALGETLAHINYLIGEGTVERVQTPGGADLYRAVAGT